MFSLGPEKNSDDDFVVPPSPKNSRKQNMDAKMNEIGRKFDTKLIELGISNEMMKNTMYVN